MFRDATFVRLLSVRLHCGAGCSSAQLVAPKMVLSKASFSSDPAP